MSIEARAKTAKLALEPELPSAPPERIIISTKSALLSCHKDKYEEAD